MHAAVARSSNGGSRMYFISLKTTPPCPGLVQGHGDHHSEGTVCGPSKTWMLFLPSARVFAAPLARVDCCCRRILFSQPDFVSQKSQLQELVKSCGHLCDFYPKYHCELNFIEQYWGAAKLHFWVAGRAATIDEMESKVIQSLDDVPLLHIRR